MIVGSHLFSSSNDISTGPGQFLLLRAICSPFPNSIAFALDRSLRYTPKLDLVHIHPFGDVYGIGELSTRLEWSESTPLSLEALRPGGVVHEQRIIKITFPLSIVAFNQPARTCVETCPVLSVIYYNGSLFPCSQIWLFSLWFDKRR